MSPTFALFVVCILAWLSQDYFMKRGQMRAALAAAWIQLASTAAYTGFLVKDVIRMPGPEIIFMAAVWALFSVLAFRNLRQFYRRFPRK